MTKFYVYGHYKPGSDIPFYIGKGSGDRAYRKVNRNSHWYSVVEKYGHNIEIMYQDLSEYQAFDIERLLIRRYGRADMGCGPLVNMTDGGDGAELSEETKLKIGLTNRGKKRTDVAKAKMSAAKKGKPSPRLGVVVNEKTRLRMSASAKNKPSITDETREKLRTSSAGRRHSEESKKKMRQARLGTRHTAAIKCKIRMGHIGMKHTEESKKKMRKSWITRKENTLL